MQSECFLDTNVLIYAATGYHDYPRHWQIAHEILGTGRNALSGQILAEFFTISTSKYRMAAATAFEWLWRLAMMPTVEVGADLVLEGVAMSQRYKISYWDGAVIAAAERAGARTLYTEDLNHGQSYGSVRVVNPFQAG